MGYLVSPGIAISEIDQLNIVPAASTSIGAYAGHFNWGPVDELVTVASEKELATVYGAPSTGSSSRSFLTAASFLKYSNSLRVSRAIGANALNAADQSPVLIKNKEIFDSLSSLDFVFSAKYPGDIGNSLVISYAYVAGSSDSTYTDWDYSVLFDGAPNQSLTAQAAGIATNDEIHVVVVDALGLFTGVKGTVLETFEGLSLGANAKSEEGASLYYKDVINNTSSYIYVNTLSDTFDGADLDIDEDSAFEVVSSALETESALDLPFLLSVETTVTYSGGATETTTENFSKTVTIKSGYAGEIGNNAKVNVRYLHVDNVTASFAQGVIYFGTPVNGDTVEVNGTTYTKVAAAPNAGEFVTIADLSSELDNDVAITNEIVDNRIIVANAATGTVGNARTLSVGGSNAGTMAVNAPTLTGGFDANDPDYVSVTIDALQPAEGYVTYDITLGVEDATTENISEATLTQIIDAINIEAAQIEDIEGFLAPSFFVDDVEVTRDSSIASMKFDMETVIPYTGSSQDGSLVVIQFTGGEVVTYNTNTLINTLTLVSGTVGTIAPGDVVTALEQFVDKDLIKINLLFAENFNTSQETVDTKVYEVANGRKDIVAFISAPIGMELLTSNTLKKAAVEAKFDDAAYTSSSYVFFDQTPVYTYNKYSDKYVWIPACGHMAGLCANTDLVSDPWFSPAGYNRGQLKGVTKIAYNPSATDRDDLYKKRINSIITVPGQGVVLFGDKTALSKPSSFSHINVRRLFNILETSISDAAKYQLFELNDEFTRSAFKNTIEPFLRDVQGRRGIIDFRVVCDETNNTDSVIDSNQFVGDIFVKYARSINFIQLNFIASRTGVDFKEIVGS